MKTRCMIVDDEPLAMVVIENYLQKFADMEIVEKCDNAITAFEVLQREKIDLIFLDIQMPKLTGIEFMKTVNNPPRVIFTTAYRDYAIEGFELDVLDYLIKPISFERFMKAINKYYKYRQEQQTQPDTKQTEATPQPVAEQQTAEEKFLFVKENKKMIKVYINDILYIESIKDYVKIVTADKSVITKQQISYYEEKLDAERFIRIHRSFIVAKKKIEAFTASSVEINEKEFPIGRSYKSEVMKKLNFEGI